MNTIEHDSERRVEAPPLTHAEIEARLAEFEEDERRRLGLEPRKVEHWHDPNPQGFAREQRETTTILIGGLTILQDALIQAAWEGMGYRIEVLECPDTAALHLGKEYGNRGQCNPTYFTVGNLVKRLIHLRDVEGKSVREIVDGYLFLTAGACGPCRFGTYATEYRKVLRDAGFDGFRVMLFQQTDGLKQATGRNVGLEMNPRFFKGLLKAIIAGDVLNAIGYRIRPYEIEPGATDRALGRARDLVATALRDGRSVLRALWRSRRELLAVEVNRLQPRPKVMVIGEFWAMTTEGDGNYGLQRFLESEGAEVDIQVVTSWLLYMLWQGRHDTRRRLELRGHDEGRRGLAGRNPRRTLIKLRLGEWVLRGTFQVFARAAGLERFHLPDMQHIADLARDYYDIELRGGEGHMEVSKLIQACVDRKAHMVLSVKPFGCMPSSGVSDGIQSAVLSHYPDAIYCPVETTGDGAVNFQSRVLMSLFKARRKAKAEFESALSRKGVKVEEARERTGSRRARSVFYPKHSVAGTAANQVLGL